MGQFDQAIELSQPDVRKEMQQPCALLSAVQKTSIGKPIQTLRTIQMKRILSVTTFLVFAISMAAAQRLPEVARPENYKLTFTPDLENAKFEGDETITVRVLKPTSKITLNAVDIDFHEVNIANGGAQQKATVSREKEKEMVVLSVEKPLAEG